MTPADDSSKQKIAGSNAGRKNGPATGHEPGPAEPGAHKPSEKHALDDVLKSLQDLIRNELLEDQRPPAPPSVPDHDPSLPRKRGRPRKPTPPEPPAVPPPIEPEAEVRAVLGALTDLVDHELNPDDSATDSIVAETLPDIPPPDRLDSPASEPVAVRGEQHAFAFDVEYPAGPALEPHPPGGETPAPEAEAIEEFTSDLPDRTPAQSAEEHADDTSIDEVVSDQVEPAVEESPGEPIPATAEPETPATGPPLPHPEPPALETRTLSTSRLFIDEHPLAATAAKSSTQDLAFDDIPVLQDVVAPPAVPAPAEATPARAPDVGTKQLHDLTIRTVARLNIELRKQGERPLNAKHIGRLQELLHEELEKATRDKK